MSAHTPSRRNQWGVEEAWFLSRQPSSVTISPTITLTRSSLSHYIIQSSVTPFPLTPSSLVDIYVVSVGRRTRNNIRRTLTTADLSPSPSYDPARRYAAIKTAGSTDTHRSTDRHDRNRWSIPSTLSSCGSLPFLGPSLN